MGSQGIRFAKRSPKIIWVHYNTRRILIKKKCQLQSSPFQTMSHWIRSGVSKLSASVPLRTTRVRLSHKLNSKEFHWLHRIESDTFVPSRSHATLLLSSILSSPLQPKTACLTTYVSIGIGINLSPIF